MESTHTHQSFPCKSEINNPSNRWMFATSENWKPNQIKSNLNKKRPKSQHQIASERRHHPYNVIPLPSTLARGVVTGKPCEHATCSVPFKEMVGSSSCRCLLLVGPVISLWFFIPFSFSGEIFIARKSLVASTWPSVVFSFIPYDGQQKHIKPISQHPSFATTNKIWSTSKRQDLSVVVLLLLLLVVVVPCCFLVSCCSVGPWGTPTLHGRCCWNSYRPSSHLGEAESAAAQPGGGFVDSFQGVLETCHEIFFRSSKLGKNILKTTKRFFFEATFRQRKIDAESPLMIGKNMEKRCVLFQKTTKTGCVRFPLCLNHQKPGLHSVELRPLPLETKLSNEKITLVV